MYNMIQFNTFAAHCYSPFTLNLQCITDPMQRYSGWVLTWYIYNCHFEQVHFLFFASKFASLRVQLSIPSTILKRPSHSKQYSYIAFCSNHRQLELLHPGIEVILHGVR